MTEGKPIVEPCADSTPRDRINLARVLWVLGVWAVIFITASQLLRRHMVPEGPMSWAVAAVGAVAGIFVLVAFGRFLVQADELQRLIQLEALAIGFGGTYFSLAGLRLLERAGAPAADLGDIALMMSALYAVGLVIAGRRYR